jgi:hypothetical protein
MSIERLHGLLARGYRVEGTLKLEHPEGRTAAVGRRLENYWFLDAK